MGHPEKKKRERRFRGETFVPLPQGVGAFHRRLNFSFHPVYTL